MFLISKFDDVIIRDEFAFGENRALYIRYHRCPISKFGICPTQNPMLKFVLRITNERNLSWSDLGDNFDTYGVAVIN